MANKVDTAIAFARAQIGKPYVFGAEGPDAYDCSGLVWAAYNAARVHLARVTKFMIFDGEEVKRADLIPGDLVFPTNHHVQLYVGNDMVIEAAHPGTFVREVKMWGFWRARRVTSDGAATGIAGDAVNAVNVFNPLNPASWGDLGANLTSPDFWKRAGLMVVGVVIVLIALLFIFRRQAETVKNGVVKTAKAAAVIGAV